MFQLDSGHVYRSQALADLPWLDHGFGTRLSTWPDPETLATVRQVHSDKVLIAEHAGVLGEADAMVTNRPGVTLAIRTADCFPILIADIEHRAVGAVHAGWRGTVEGILSKTLDTMRQHFDTRPDDVVVAVGPGIQACCFEVGPEVSSQFGLSGRVKIDLVETNRRHLGRNSGSLRQFATSGLCTCCDGAMFHSYRRDREAARRMVSMIGIL